MKLYEINEAIENCIDMETGEIIDANKLDELQMQRDEKIENVALWIKNLTAEGKAIKEEVDSLNARRKTASNKIQGLKNYLQYALNGNKFKTAKASISYRKSQKVEILNLEEFQKKNDDLLKYSEPVPDKTAIKEAIKCGRKITGAELVESTSVIIK